MNGSFGYEQSLRGLQPRDGESLYAYLFRLRKESEDEKKQPKLPVKRGRGPKFIQPMVKNFKRSKAGERLIVQEVRRLLEKQKALFPTKPMADVDFSNTRFTDHGETKSISYTLLMQKAPRFFDSFFSATRNKLLYGTKVQEWLSQAPRFRCFWGLLDVSPWEDSFSLAGDVERSTLISFQR